MTKKKLLNLDFFDIIFVFCILLLKKNFLLIYFKQNKKTKTNCPKMMIMVVGFFFFFLKTIKNLVLFQKQVENKIKEEKL